jgi:excisionase family DNA binding protein
MLDPLYEEHARLVAARVAEMLRERSTVVPEYLNPEDAAVLVGISKRTLENYRVRDDGGPPFLRVGGLVRYKVADLREWIERGRVEPEQQ